MKNKPLLLFLILIFIATALPAQERRNNFFLTDSMLKNVSWFNNRYFTIEQNWKYHAADPLKVQANFASPDFDDHAWENVNTALPVDSLPENGWKGIGWFRLHLTIDSALLNKPLALNVLQLGASDVYIDGQLFCSFGKVGTSSTNEEGLNTQILTPRPVTFSQPQHIIAIRYSSFNIMQNRPPTLNSLGFKLAVGNLDEVSKTILGHAKFFMPVESLAIAVPLTFALIHFIMFFFYRREKSNLYFAIFTVVFAVWGFLEHEAVSNSDAALVLLLKRLWLPYLALMPVTGLRFLYSLFYKTLPRQFWFLLVVSLVTAIWSWFYLIPWTSLILFLVSLSEMIRIAIVAMRKKIPGAWIIGAGFAAFCSSLVLLTILSATGNFSLMVWYILIYLTGVLPILLSMSVYLSQRVAITHKNLETQMRKTLELEVENTRKETELKKAEELKEAYDALERAHTTLKATQSQLIQSEKMASLGELTAGIAHEIQNPLNFVNNFSDINTELIEELQQELQSGNTEDAMEISNDIKQNEEKINHHGKRADSIVKGMLQHSQKSSGQKEPTDINKLADEYLRLSYHGLRAKDKEFNADIKTDFDESIGNINIIPQDIGRVLLNLFNNAFYAVKPPNPLKGEHYSPTVKVSTKKIDNKVEISVADNGNGIPQKIVDKIFQPFFTTKPTGEGTGLGLSLSYDIIKAHSGEIKVESKEGEGTTFIIQLPVS